MKVQDDKNLTKVTVLTINFYRLPLLREWEKKFPNKKTIDTHKKVSFGRTYSESRYFAIMSKKEKGR